MAGHSKWANIKHRKEKSDTKKGKIFSRISKEIISAVKLGGADSKSNARLKVVLQKAKIANVPNDNIERLIKKASSTDQADFTEVMYEIYGHGGVGILVQILTDNKNRAASEMRIATNKRGGNIATPGSVAFLFDRKGIIEVLKPGVEEETLFLDATDFGAEDFETTDDFFLITTQPTDLYAIKDRLTEKGYSVASAEWEMIPKSFIACNEENFTANMALIDWLEALEDVDEVYHNMEPEEQ